MINRESKNLLPLIDYDKEADVLYISFRKPQHAAKTIEVDDDILIRKSGRSLVGITIMNASTHLHSTQVARPQGPPFDSEGR